MSHGLGSKMALVDLTNSAALDELVTTLNADEGGHGADGEIQKNLAASVICETKAQTPRQARGAFALEQMERTFDAVGKMFYRRLPKKIV